VDLGTVAFQPSSRSNQLRRLSAGASSPCKRPQLPGLELSGARWSRPYGTALRYCDSAVLGPDSVCRRFKPWNGATCTGYGATTPTGRLTHHEVNPPQAEGQAVDPRRELADIRLSDDHDAGSQRDIDRLPALHVRRATRTLVGRTHHGLGSAHHRAGLQARLRTGQVTAPFAPRRRCTNPAGAALGQDRHRRHPRPPDPESGEDETSQARADVVFASRCANSDAAMPKARAHSRAGLTVVRARN